MNVCAMTPQVRNIRTNVVEDSRLFKDLLASSANRASAVDLYLATKTPEFESLGKKFTLDDRNEPILSSLVKHTDIGNSLVKDGVLERLEIEIGATKKKKEGEGRNAITYPSNLNTKDRLAQKAVDFNKHSEYKDTYVATYSRVNAGSRDAGIQLEISPRVDFESRDVDLAFNTELDTIMRGILRDNGVSIGSLNALEERMKVNGVTDFSTAKRTAEGFLELIRLRDGKEGSEALPEEFSHWAIEAHKDKALIARLVNAIKDEKTLREILGDSYSDYFIEYAGNMDRLAREAAGKLLAEAFKRTSTKNLQSASLLTRVKDFIVNLFPKTMGTAIRNALYSTTKKYDALAASIMANPSDLSNDNIDVKDSLFSIAKANVASISDMFKTIIENEEKRLQIYRNKYKTEKARTNQEDLIKTLQTSLDQNKINKGITDYLDRAYINLTNTMTKLKDFENLSSSERASLLENSRKYISSYKYIAKSFLKSAAEAEYSDEVDTYPEDIVNLMVDFNAEVNKIDNKVKALAKKEATAVLNAYIPKGMTVSSTDNTPITGEFLMSDDKLDVGIFSKWLNSAANSSSHLINIIDNMLKRARALARRDTLADKQRLQAAQMKLEKSGIKNTEWMLEVDSEGKKTGYYIRNFNKGEFNKARNAELDRIKEKYDFKDPKQRKEAIKVFTAWRNKHMERINGALVPRITPLDGISYANPVFNNMTSVQREYYELILAMKEAAEFKINSRNPKEASYNIVAIKSDTMENIRNNPKDAFKHLKQAVNDTLVKVEDEDTFGVGQALTDLEGGKVEMLPIYYQSFSENSDALQKASPDVTETMALYMNMANNFHHLEQVGDTVEMIRHAYGETNTTMTNAGRAVKKVRNRLSKSGSEDAEADNALVSTKETNAYEHLNNLISSQLYGKYIKDEGDIKIGNRKISISKAADFLINLTSKNSLMFNYLSESASVTQGVIAANVEAVGARFFSVPELGKADTKYAEELTGLLGDFGARTKKSKLGLFLEHFNVMLDNESSLREIKSEFKSKAGRLTRLDTLSFIKNCGEHWMYSRTALALALKTKVKLNGEEINLYEAMELVDVDPDTPEAGKKIQYKQGVTDLDGNPISDNYNFSFETRIHAINHELHGIYNAADKNALQRVSLGRLVMLFRGWMVPAYLRRFGSEKYNMSLDEHTKGYYISMKNFLHTLAKDTAKLEIHYISRFNELTPMEQANVKMALTELMHFVVLTAMVALIEFPDDKDRHWLYKYTEYLLYRTHTELAVMVPSPAILKEGGRIIASPSAAVGTLESILSLFDLLDPRVYMHTMDSGRYKGDSEAQKTFMNALPFSRTIHKVSNPDTLMPFFNQ